MPGYSADIRLPRRFIRVSSGMLPMQCTATHAMQHHPLALGNSSGNVADAVQGNSYRGIHVASQLPMLMHGCKPSYGFAGLTRAHSKASRSTSCSRQPRRPVKFLCHLLFCSLTPYVTLNRGTAFHAAVIGLKDERQMHLELVLNLALLLVA